MRKQYQHILEHIGFRNERLVGFLLISFLTVILVTPALGQMDSLETGEKVKISVPSVSRKSLVGFVSGSTPTTLSLDVRDTTFLIPKASIHKLSISWGKKRSTLKGALIGAATGGFILGVAAVISNLSSNDDCNEYGNLLCGGFDYDDTQRFLIGTTAGIIIGGSVGAIVGTFTFSDRWKQVPVNLGAGLITIHPGEIGIHPMVSVKVPLSKWR